MDGRRGFVGCPVLLSGAAGTLSQGRALEVTFSASSSSSDVLLFFHNDPVTVTGSPVITTELYEGRTLIASTSNPPDFTGGGLRYIAIFQAPTATYNGWLGGWSGRTATTDLTLLSKGTNQGRIRVTVAGGSISGIDTEAFRLQDARSFVTPYTPGMNVGARSRSLSRK